MRKIKVSTIWDKASKEMADKGLSPKTVKNYRHVFSQLANECPDGCYDADVGMAFATKAVNVDGVRYSQRYRSTRRRVVGMCEHYLSTDGVCLSETIGGKSKLPSSKECLDLIEELKRYCKENELSKKTLGDYIYVSAMYLRYLEECGVSYFNARPSTISAFITHLRDKGSASSKALLMSHLRPLFVISGRHDLYEASRMVGVMQPHNPPTRLSDSDVEKLAQARIDDRVSKKCAAITLLAITTGLRACDIANLRISDIDPNMRFACLVQKKTGNPVRIPIIEPVANAISAYIEEERPNTEDDHLFVSDGPKGRRYANPSSIRDILSAAFDVAGIEGVPVGTRSLRHSAASRMVRARHATLPIVSAVLGHTCTTTTDRYVQCDEAGMLECVLPLPKEVLAC